MPNYAKEDAYTQAEIDLWQTLCQHQNEVFLTKKGLKFTYKIRGNELFVDRRGKSITRASVNRAYARALELGDELTGPKMLGTFGASYLYPLFSSLGL